MCILSLINPDTPKDSPKKNKWEPEPLHIEEIIPDVGRPKKKNKDNPEKRVIIIDI